MKVSKFKRVDLESSREIHFHDHEILMSFYDDEGCEAFCTWWDKEGSKVFNEWLKLFEEYEHLTNKKEDNEMTKDDIRTIEWMKKNGSI
jgi:hypothetical protein